MRRSIVLVLVLVVVSASCFAVRQHTSHSSRVASSSHDGTALASEVAEDSPPQALSRAGFQPGVEYQHQIEYRLLLGPANGEGGLAYHLSARATSTVSTLSASSISLRLQLSDVKLEAPGAPDSALIATRAALARPLLVDYDLDGRARRLHVSPNLEPLALNLLRELVCSTQFSAPEAPARHWNHAEFDPSGEYEAAYVASGPDRFNRNKSRYLSLTQGSHATEQRAYAARFELDAWGRVSALDVASDVALPSEQGTPSLATQTQLSVRTLTRRVVTPFVPIVDSGLVVAQLSLDADSFKSSAHAADVSALSGATLPELLGALRALAPDDRVGASNVQTRLTALFRINPRAATAALAALDRGNASAIFGALASAGTPEAQQALADAIRKEQANPELRQAALDATLLAEHPSSDMLRATQEASQSGDPESKHNASLVLGALARRSAAEDGDSSQAAVKALAEQASTANAGIERVNALNALGNSGSTQAMPAIAQSLASDDPGVRAAATQALRFVQDPSVDPLLVKSLSDGSPEVRRAALFAAGYRAYDAVGPTLESIAKQDPEPGVRSEVVSTLSQLASSDSTDALQLLNWIAEHDPEQSVRKRAAEVL
ncbi:MAG TPA: HEAT repeat domain-containing protein, partial [Polyangiaceae bacterium]